MHRSFFALALASAAITPAFAQADVIGSGISPSSAPHSQTRPINFAATAPTAGALVILMRNATLPANVRATHVSLFDGSLQGLAFTDKPAFGFQGHPEASPGPNDVAYLFDRFIDLMGATKNVL